MSLLHAMGSSRRAAAVAALVLLAASASACSLFSPFDDYDQRGGPEIAARIEAGKSPIVVSVVYLPGDPVDPASVRIVIRTGATRSEVDSLMCGLIVPAIRHGDPPEAFSVRVFDDSSVEVADDEWPCPTTVP